MASEGSNTERVAAVIAVLLFVTLGLSWYWLHDASESDPLSIPQDDPRREPGLPRPNASAGSALPQLPSDFEWEDADEDELRDLTVAVEKSTLDHASQFDAVLAEGEMIVTEAYEPQPGVFVFTSITPSVETSDNGETMIVVDMERVSVDVSGNSEILTQPKMVIGSGALGIINLYTDEDVHQIWLQPELLPDGSGVWLRGSESIKPAEESPASGNPVAAPAAAP